MTILIERVYETMAWVRLTLDGDIIYSEWKRPKDHRREVHIDSVSFQEDIFIVKYLNKDAIRGKRPEGKFRGRNII